jgi:hypothetical protein
MKYILEIQENQEHEYYGAIIKYPNPRWYHFPLGNGRGIAHDILQHPFKPHVDPFIDELMALGAMMIHLPYSYRSFGDAEKIVGHELSTLFKEEPVSLSFASLHTLPRVRNAARNTELFRDIEGAYHKAQGFYREEYMQDLDEAPDSSWFDRELILGWMYKGSQLFSRRFGRNLYDICNHVNDAIEEEVDKWLKFDPPVGATADLFVTFSRYKVSLVDNCDY